ncbi:MAG: hypothetical protein R2875_12170 [Desulfobacterales bacterium]
MLARCNRPLRKTFWYVLAAAIVVFLILTALLTDLYTNYREMLWLVIFPCCACSACG